MTRDASTIVILKPRQWFAECVKWALLMATGAALATLYHRFQATTTAPPQPMRTAQHDVAQQFDRGVEVAFPVVDTTLDGSPRGGAASAALLEQWLGGAIPARDDEAEAPFTQLAGRVQHDKPFRQQLMQRFAAERDPQARQQLAALLGAARTDDVSRFASDLARSPDAGARQRAVEVLLALQGPDASRRQTLVAMLGAESDATTLGMIVSGLQPDGPRDPQEVAWMLERLRKLEQHESPAVRAAALVSSARWGGAAAEPSILQGLADPDTTVMKAAIEAVAEAGMRSGAAADALLSVAERSDLALEVRQMAVDSLAELHLDASRFGRFSSLHRALSAAGG